MLGADGKVRVLKLQRKTNTDPEKLPVRTIQRLPTRSCTFSCLLLRTLPLACSNRAVCPPSRLTVCVLLSLTQWKMSPASRALATSSVASLFDPNRLFSPPRKRVSETAAAADWSAR